MNEFWHRKRGEGDCVICSGEGWVCEYHTTKSWGGGEGCCGGAGAPCTCNDLHPANWTEEEKKRMKEIDHRNKLMNGNQ